MIYMFAFLFTQAMLDDQDHLELFGSLATTMMTLFKMITGGCEWSVAVQPLQSVHNGGIYVALLMFYVAFSTFAVLNVITGVFCQSAVEGAADNQAEAIEAQVRNKVEYAERVKTLFRAVDQDSSGDVSESEFSEFVESDIGRAYLAGLGMEPDHAWTLFRLI